MNRLCLTLSLFLCFPVFADWQYISTENESNNEFYLDFETLRKDGSLRRIWQVVNLATNEHGWLSIRSIMEFDCKNETVQGLARMAFSEKFANGKVLHKSDDRGTKSYIPPNSVASTQLREVCKR
jgi:hypothetical protein